MTYRDLIAWLKSNATEEQLDQDVTILDSNTGEFFGAVLDIAEDNGVLDDGHLFFTMRD